MATDLNHSDPILPGATLGVFGSGQLGRMFAQVAARMGYHVHVYSPDASLDGSPTPAGEVTYRETCAPYEDLESVAQFAKSVDVITLEFENIATAATDAAAQFAPVRPAGSVLHTTQNRLREKTFLQESGIPCTTFAAITSEQDLATAEQSVGLPAVLKTSAWGYDGKGQAIVHSSQELRAAWDEMENQPAVLEGFVDFECELSMLVARSPANLDGTCQFATCGPLANDHVNHTLDITTFPAPKLVDFSAEAAAIATSVSEQLDATGLICIEFFLTKSGKLLVNEIAPRTHNSGHLTIEACRCSQFEQQLRSICNLPLGSFESIAPAAMANLLGDLWFDADGQPRTPNWEAALGDPRISLYLYGKAEPRPGRKMGHLTAIADSAATAAETVRLARAAL